MRRSVAFGVATVAIATGILSSAHAATTDDFARAERIRSFDDRALGGIVFPHWLPDGVRFAYLSRSASEPAGAVFLVDPRTNGQHPLFKAVNLAAALSKASGTKVDSVELPGWQLTGDARALVASAGELTYVCSLPSLICRVTDIAAKPDSGIAPTWATRSPDGKWDAFVWNYNLYIRPAGMQLPSVQAGTPIAKDGDGNSRFGQYSDDYGFQPTGQREGCDYPAPRGPVDTTPPTFQAPPPDSIALTTDGERLYSYGPRWKLGAEPATLDADRYRPTKAAITWSPDSRKLVIHREDLRGVGVYPLYSSTSNHPIDHSYFYAAPGADHVPQYDLYVADIAKRSARKTDVPANGEIDTAMGEVWSPDSRRILVANSARDFKTAALFAVDPETSRSRSLIRETSDTYVRMSSSGATNIAVDDKSGDLFWFSERDGWGHLYRYGADGTFKNQLDKGKTVFSQIIHVDGEHQDVYFTAWGGEAANPYNRHFYRIHFDGSGLTVLTPEPGDHDIHWAPGGSYVLDTYQSVDTPPVTVARGIDGHVIQTVSRGSDAPLRSIGWHPAEQFTVKARDGKTDLYGILYKPRDFDPSKRYPVIVNIYPVPRSAVSVNSVSRAATISRRGRMRPSMCGTAREWGKRSQSLASSSSRSTRSAPPNAPRLSRISLTRM